MSGSFNMNTWTAVNQDTKLYESSATSAATDYILDLNMNSSDLFTSAHYRQNSGNPNLYDVKVALNGTLITSALNGSVTISSSEAQPDCAMPRGSGAGGVGTAGELLLQVMSIKIFNNPKAGAAISNDSEYLSSGTGSLSETIGNNIASTFTAEASAIGGTAESNGTSAADLASLFEYYVALGRVSSSDDISDWVPMNFTSNDKFTFPFYLHGQLMSGSHQTGATDPLLASYVDTTHDGHGNYTGKDHGKGFISSGSSAKSNVTSTPLDVGEYDVPITLRVTIN